MSVFLKKPQQIYFPILFLLALLLGQELFGQTKKGVFAPFIIENGDTMPIIILKEVVYNHELDSDEKQRQELFAKLIRDLRITMPYAIACANKIKEIDDNSQSMSRKEKRRYLKEQEKQLRTEFEDKLKDLSPRQGRLLIKLIDRQTGMTSYSLIKEYKNGITAFFWQSMASFFSMSLKTKYDKEEEPQIEYALQVLGYR